MNRAAPRSQQQSIPSGYRPSQPPQPGAPGTGTGSSASQGSTGMYFATAGSQSTTGAGTTGSTTTTTGGRQSMPPTMAIGGGGGFPPIGGTGSIPRGPPGFTSRSDQNDFPALGSLNLGHTGSYASQATTQQGGSNHLFGMGQGTGGNGLIPPPPPGMGGGPTTPNSQTNGLLENLRGEDFPALGGQDGKDRLANYLRGNLQGGPPSPPSTLPNGASTSHSNSATPSTNPPHPTGTGGAPSTTGDSWTRHSPSSRPSEPLLRPVQQILSSPVDQWGLKALLYEIKTQMGKGDRGMLLFGEELSELGVDVSSEEPLYASFVTPWADISQIQPVRIQENYHIPSCYQFPVPPLKERIKAFTEDSLFLVFYASPGDTLQLEAAGELYSRGWRYHTELQLWFLGTELLSVELPLPTTTTSQQPQPHWIGGHLIAFDPNIFGRREMPGDYMVNAALLEATRPAAIVIASEENGRKEVVGGMKSPSGQAGVGQTTSIDQLSQGVGGGGYQS